MTWDTWYLMAYNMCLSIDKKLQDETDLEMIHGLVTIHAIAACEVAARMRIWFHGATEAMVASQQQQVTTILAASVQTALKAECYDVIDLMFEHLVPCDLPVSVVAPLLLKTKDVRDKVQHRSAFLALVEQRLIDSNDPERAELMYYLQ